MSANYENLDTETHIAGANLNGLLYRCLQLNAAGRVVVGAAADDYVIGVLAHDPKRSQTDSTDTTGDPVTVANMKGKVPVVAEEAIAVGNFVVPGASGKVADGGSAIASITANSYVLGVAMEEATADGDIILIKAQPFFNAA